MSYSESFSRQWENLRNNFVADMSNRAVKDITVPSVSKWYKSAAFRWNSLITVEGKLLDAEKDEKFKQELLKYIGDFRFSEEEGVNKPSPIPYVAAGVIAAAAAGSAIRYFKHISWVPTVFISLAVLLVPVAVYAKMLDDYNIKGKRKLIDKYAAQMDEYRNKLLKICKKYGK